MAPYPASVSGSDGSSGSNSSGSVVPRSASPSSAPFLPPSSTLDKRSAAAQELSPHLPYLNSTFRAEKRSSIPPELKITARSEHNLTARSEYNLTERADTNLTTRSAFNLTARSDLNLKARSGLNLTARSDFNLTTRSSFNLTARSEFNLTARSDLNLTARSDHNITAQPFHNLAIRTEKHRSTPAFYPNVTARSEHNVTARAEYLPTSLDHSNLTARSDHNLTAGGYQFLPRSDHNLTSSPSVNLTARFAYNLTTDPNFNLAERSDYNLTARSGSNLTARSDSNLTARSNINLTARYDHSASVLSSPKMIIRTDQDGQAQHSLVSRSTTTYTPCVGCTDPSKINNKAFFALFAILGVVMVVGGIWFFFHAKNGGFVWQQNDWDDYKSTVLRRKGPDGKTLSNATKSTRLGGGSIIARHDRIAAMSVVGYDEKGRKGVRAKRGFGGTHSIYYDDDFSRYSGSQADEKSEVSTNMDYHRVHHRSDSHDLEAGKHHSRRYGGRDRDVHEYKHEKPARVGGMNRVADGSNYTYSDDTATQISESTNRSTANLIRDKERESPARTEAKKRAKAERKAHEEASRMERKWRKDAEAAARAIARENAPSPVPPQQAHRSARKESRSSSPKKRDYSFSKGADETLSTAYTASTSGDRSASYYDSYRPKSEQARAASKTRPAGESSRGYRRYAESEAETSDSGTRIYEHRLNKGPVKEKKSGRGGRDVMAGYRRGRDDDDF